MTALSQELAEQLVSKIYLAATPVLQIYGIADSRWHRNVPTDDQRYGPWLQGRYRVLDKNLWSERAPCLYLVAGERDKHIRYVGISRNRMKDRWRESPAIDHETGNRIEHQLFHSQCWRQIEAEYLRERTVGYEVRCVLGKRLTHVLSRLGQLPAELTTDDSEAIVTAVERWICGHSSETLVPWNIAMTTGKRIALTNADKNSRHITTSSGDCVQWVA